MKKSVSVLLFTSILLTGCGSAYNIATVPNGAKLYVNGRLVGNTPKDIEVEFADNKNTHKLSVAKEGYQTESQYINKNTSEQVSINLKPVVCKTTITSNAKNAELMVGEEKKGKIPYTQEFTFGDTLFYDLTLVNDGYARSTTKLTYDNCKAATNISLEPVEKIINFTSSPNGASVYLDNRYIGATPISYKVAFGDKKTHKVTYSKYGYLDKSESVGYDFKMSTLMMTLENNPYSDLAYVSEGLSNKSGNIEFEIKYEKAFKDTVDHSPSALNVKQVLKMDSTDALIGGIDSKNKDVAYTIIYPKIKINSSNYILTVSSLKMVIEKLYEMEKTPNEYEQIVSQIERITGLKSIDEQSYSYLMEVFSGVRKDKSINGYKQQILEVTKRYEGILKHKTIFLPTDFYSEIWLTDDIKGTKRSRITFSDGRWIDNSPALDSKYVYFSSNRNSKDFEIWRVNRQGGSGLTKITNSPYSQDFSPATEHNGGNVIAYVSIPLDATNAQVWTINKEGTLPSQLKEGKEPSINGGKIAFIKKSEFNNNYQIWTINIDGSNESVLTEENYNSINPAISPDGKWIAYTSEQAGNKDIWLMKIDGSQKTQLTMNPSADMNPVWGDDNYIYFVSNRGVVWGVWKLKPNITME